MAKPLDDVKVEWQSRFTFIRLERIELIEDWDLGDLLERGSICLAHINLNE